MTWLNWSVSSTRTENSLWNLYVPVKYFTAAFFLLKEVTGNLFIGRNLEFLLRLYFFFYNKSMNVYFNLF